MAPISTYLTTLLKPPSNLDSHSTLAPIESDTLLRVRNTAKPTPQNQNPNFQPGTGTWDPHTINNKGIFALFALLGVAMVLTAIWFFFWAKNGGFHFREGDWEDYKSTVLRRKGPNGTTLSGATKTTKLGGGSIVAEAAGEKGGKAWKRGEQKQGKKGKRGNKNNADPDIRAYRHEKPARVGGLNREADGVGMHDFAYTDNTYSDDISSQAHSAFVPINTPRAAAKKAGQWTKPAKKEHPTTPTTPKTQKKKDFYHHTPTSNASTDSHRPLRPHQYTASNDTTPTRSRNSSPRKSTARGSVPGSFYTEPLDFESRYHGSDGVSEDSRGTKAYFHPIPGLGSDGGRGRGGAGNAGFRRGRGRRDSLSDSEGETVGS